jgi:hypothetical protein
LAGAFSSILFAKSLRRILNASFGPSLGLAKKSLCQSRFHQNLKRSRASGLHLDPFHVRITQAEMVADFVDEDMGDDFAQRLFIL